MLRPNFFIVGAPKCGTTAMYQYLRSHPQIFMPPEKEPHFFATDLSICRRMTTKSAYLALFEGATSAHSAIGEASVWYLFSERAAQEIKTFNPDAKILVFFRSPVDFVQSLHAQFAYNEGRDPNFLMAWEDADSREQLLHAGAFGTQFVRLMEVFSLDQVLVVLQDELKETPRQEYLRVLRFLGVKDDGRTEFSAFNSNKTHRIPAIARFSKNTPASLVRTWSFTKNIIGLRRLGLLDKLHDLNTRPVPRAAIPCALRDEIKGAFATEIKLLSDKLQRDLSHWL